MDEPLVDCPVEESLNQATGRWAAAVPGVDIGLPEVFEGETAAAEPVDEVDRDGGALLGSQERAVRRVSSRI